MDSILHEQAIEVSEALSMLLRRFSAIDTEGPTADLPVAQLRVCGILRSGQRTMSALSKELGISLSAVTQLADRLEKAQLVERVVEADDHRVKCLQLTQHGRQVVEARKSKRVERVLDALGRLSPRELDLAIRGMRVLVNAADVSGFGLHQQ
jgi:DNA-binding MarR family transcriptional regulator